MENKQSILENFVVLEGIDGAGTTTQLRLIEARCRQEGIPCFCTFEPTGNCTGKAIRSILRGDEEVEPGTMAYLFAADRFEHLYNETGGILQHLKNGEMVICDRYLFSSLAYQSINCGFDFVFNINKDFPLPAHLIFLDVTVEVGHERLSGRNNLDIFENDSFQQSVLTGYNEAICYYAESGMMIHKLDGTEPAEVIFKKIWDILGSLPIFNK